MNKVKYYFYQLFKELTPIYPIYLILFDSKGFDIFYAFGFVFWGVSGTFCSGAEEALLFDSLKMSNEENLFDKVYGRGKFLSGISVAIASLAGGYIAMYVGMEWALGISIFVGVLTTGIAASFHEVNHYIDKKVKSTSRLRSILTDEIRFFRKKRRLTLIAFMAILVVGTAGVIDEYDQLIAKGFGLSVGTVGLWVSFRSLVAALGSLVAPYLRNAVDQVLGIKKNINSIGCICIVGAIFLGLSGSIKQLWAMIFYGIFFFLMAACEVLQEDYVQQRIEEEGRSTVHSMISLMYNLFGMVFYGVLGIVFALSDLFTGLIIIAVYMVIIVLLLSYVNKLYEKSCKRTNLQNKQ